MLSLASPDFICKKKNQSSNEYNTRRKNEMRRWCELRIICWSGAVANLYEKCRRQVDKRKQKRAEKNHETCIHSRRRLEQRRQWWQLEDFLYLLRESWKRKSALVAIFPELTLFTQQHQRLLYKVAFMNPSKVGSTLFLSCASHLNWILSSQRIKIRIECLHFRRCNIRTFKSRALNNDSESFN